MRRLAIAALAASIAAGCARKPAYAIYTKGPPRRVEVEKRATEPRTQLRAMIDRGAIVISVLSESEVDVTRRVIRSTYVIEGRGPLITETFELLLTPVMLLGLPFLRGLDGQRREGPESSRGYSPGLLISWIDPRRSLTALDYTGRVSDEDRFPDPPIRRRYRVALPAPGIALRYRVVSISRQTLAEGTARSDVLGEVTIGEVAGLERAVAIEIAAGEAPAQLILLERPARETARPPPPQR